MSTDDGMYNKVRSIRSMSRSLYKNELYISVKNESYIKNCLIYMVYICIRYVFGSVK